MNIETLETAYPKLFRQLPEEIDDIRALLIIDENENDGDVDELDEVDAEDYNYILYLTETLQSVIGGEEELIALIRKLDEKREFQDFFPSEIDLYGVQTELDEVQIARVVLNTVEEMLA
jgi:hypothetical protein